ncbi:MAG TPA: hypothetical protein VH575_18600 [Gemmataceae bacterium]
MSDVLILEKHKDLFKDDEAVRKFARLLREATQGRAMQLLLFDENLLGAIISTEAAQAHLRERIAARLVQDPKSLEVLKERLKSEDLVPLATPTPEPTLPPRHRRGSRGAGQKAGNK